MRLLLSVSSVLGLALSLAAPASADFAYRVVAGAFSSVAEVSAAPTVAEGTSPAIALTVTPLVNNFGVEFTGTIHVPVDGTYLFSLMSDEGSDLALDGAVVVNNDGLHSIREVTASVAMTAGAHALRVRYFDVTGLQTLQLTYAPPGGGKRELSASGVLDGPPDPRVVGSWSAPIAWPFVAVSAANMPDGRVVSWVSTKANRYPGNAEFTLSAIFDPSTGAFQTTNNDFHDMFCAGIATLEDGRVVAAGGNPYDTRVSTFDPSAGTWQPLAEMNFNRWYPTTLTLANNELFTTFANAGGSTSERYDALGDAWTYTPGATQIDLLNEQNAENGQSKANEASALSWFGQMAVAPDGRVFHGGPAQTWHMFDPLGVGAAQSLGQPVGARTRMWGNTVSYDAGKVLLIGGADRTLNPPTTAAAYAIDLNGASPVISSAAPMNFPRAYNNTVTLPTGELLVVGGNTSGELLSDAGSVYPAEIYDPETDQWRIVESLLVPRNYHSTALLLKDARVLAAGGGACGNGCPANHLDAQIFSPPYLYAPDGSPAVRPSITAAPALAEAGAELPIAASGTIEAFSMVRLSGTTHHINTDQRFLPLEFVDHADGTYTLTLESNPNILIPGYYWIFALDGAGVPSIGRTFQVVRDDGSSPGLEIEAESAVLAGSFALGEDAAARNGRFISVPSAAPELAGPISDNRAILTFEVPTDGYYKLEAGAHAPGPDANSFWVTVDGSPAAGFEWELPAGAGYPTSFVTHLGAPVRVPLLAGTRTVEIIHREAGARLDWIRLVYDGPPPPPGDRDGDGVPDETDAFPDDPTEWADGDGDGVGDNADAFPADPTKWLVEHGVAPVSVPARSATLVVESSSGVDRVWNVNPDNDSVTVSNAAGVKLAEVSVGSRPWALAKAPLADEMFVANKGSATLSVISTQSLAVTRTIALPPASQPHGVAFAPGSDDLYVVLEALARVDRYAASAGTWIASAVLSGKPRHVAVSADGSELYVPNFVTPPIPGESGAEIDYLAGGSQLFVVDTAGMTLDSTVTFRASARPASEVSGPGMPNYLSAPVVFGGRAYVPSKQDNLEAGAYRGGPGMTFDQTVRAVTSIVDLATRTEIPALRIDHDNAGLATGAAISGSGKYLFVALETSREIAVYDTELGFQLTRIDVGRAPQGVAFSADGRTLYVHNYMDRSISRIDVTDLVALGTPETTALGDTVTVAAESLPANVLLGKQLFYDARDSRLARDRYLSCGACHNDAGSDGRVWDLTGLGEGLRSTPDLRGRGGMGDGLVHWTGNFDEIQDFEGQIRALSDGTGLMSDAEYFTGTRSQPLGDAKAGLSADLDALAAFVGSLSSTPLSPHRGTAFTAAAEAGRAHFASQNCGSCHGGARFTDSTLAPVRHDVGTLTPASGSRLGAPLDGLDTPTLIGAWGTAPYLHDGSAGTLEDAVAAHGSSLDASQLAELAAFLRELNPGDTPPNGDVVINDEVSVAFVAGNPCGTNLTATGGRCVGNLLALSGLAQSPDAIEDSLHTGTHALAFVSSSAGTAQANLIFDLGAPNAADAIVLWNYFGSKLDSQVQAYEIRTSNAREGTNSLASPVVVASGTLPRGTTDNSGQRIGGLTLGRYVQIAGLTNYGSSSTHGLGAVAFVRTPSSTPPVNQPPVLVAPGPQSGTVGAGGSLALSATDPNLDPLLYSAAGLPTGLSLDPNSGVISGTFAAEGIYAVTVGVSDGRGGSDSEIFDWTVEPAPPADQWMNDQVSIVYARGNPCGADYASLGSKCAGWLLPQTGLTYNAAAIEDSLHTGSHLQAFVSNSAGTPQANLIFDLGSAGLANTLILWNYTGSKTSSQVRDFEVWTSDTLDANGSSLVSPTLVVSGSLPLGTSDNSGQRFDGVAFGRFVQIVGLTNYGASGTNGLGKVGFVLH